jgi:hypothetical protein
MIIVFGVKESQALSQALVFIYIKMEDFSEK